MITIKIKAIMKLAELFGKHEFNLSIPEGSRVSDVVDQLTEEYGKGFTDIIRDSELDAVNGLNWNVQYFLNGRNVIFLDGLSTEFQDGDVLFFLQPVGGG